MSADVCLHNLPVALGRRGALARRIFRKKTITGVGDCGRGTLAPMRADRISAAIDQALEPLRLIARGACTPIRKATDRPSPFEAITLASVVQDECAATGSGDAETETRHALIVGDAVALGRFRQRLANRSDKSLAMDVPPCPQCVRTDMCRCCQGTCSRCPALSR